MSSTVKMVTEQHVEAPEPPESPLKRKFEPSVLDNFTKLTNGHEKIRIKSGVDLLKHLTDKQDDTTEKSESELKYALGRFVRGLGSSKIHARTGFFACLVGLLNLKNVTIEEIFTCVSKKLHKGGSNSKSENADISSGQVLVAGAVLRSNLYENLTEEEKTKVLELLINAGKQRTYLALASYKFLIDLYTKVDSKEFDKIILPLIRSEITKPWNEHDLDSLYLLIETHKSFPDVIKIKFLQKSLGSTEIFCQETLPELCNVLSVIPRIIALKHPIFEICIKKLLDSSFIVEFFNQLDTTLARPNRNKYFVFLKLLTSILENLADLTIIPDLITRNFLQQTLNTFKTAVGKHKDKEFQQSVQKLFETLLDNLKKDSVKTKTKIKVIKKMLFYPGTFIFEKVTKSKLIQNITQTLSTEGVKKLGAIYRDVVLAEKDRVIKENVAEKWWNIDRIYASHLLVKLLSHVSMQNENEWKVEQLVFLMKLGLSKNQAENIGNELADAFKETFYSSLDLKLSKLEDLRVILSQVVKDLDENLNQSNLEEVLRQPISAEDYATWQQTVHLCAKIEGKKKKAVFHTLFLHLSLQLFNNNTKLASDSLKELFSCYARVKKSKTTDDTSDDLLWIEVVVDLFLNLLSHNSHLLRNVVNCVFPHLCKHMNSNAIHQILSVLDPKNEENPLSKRDDVDEDTDDDDGDDDNSEDSSESDEELNEIEEESDDDNVNDKLRMALQQVLGADAASDAESIDLDDLDEENGEKLDEALGQAFKQFKPNLGRKKKQNKDDQTLTHFRVRVLDLLEIYLNSNPSMLLTLEIMLPLLQTLEFSIRDDHQKPLQDRVRACLKKLSTLKKFDDVEGVTQEALVELLKSLLEKGTKNAIIIQDMGEKISECCIFVINCSQVLKNSSEPETPKSKKNKKHQKDSISGVIKANLETFFKKRDCLTPYVLFKNVLQLNWDGVLDFIPLLMSFVFTDTIRPFRRSQALELLKIFYNNHRFLKSHPDEVKVVEETEKNFLLDCIGFFKEFCESPSERKVKEKFICNLFALLNEVKIIRGDSFKAWDQMAEVSRECRSHVTFSKDTKVAFGKLCKSLNVSNVVQMKSKMVKLSNNEVEDKDEVEKEAKSKKKKKKGLNKDKLKQKKESKELRLQSLSEGFGSGKRKFAGENGDVNKKIKVDVEDDDDDDDM